MRSGAGRFLPAVISNIGRLRRFGEVRIGQLTDVIAHPQRGQKRLRPEAQVVPQFEQVQQPETGEVVPQA